MLKLLRYANLGFLLSLFGVIVTLVISYSAAIENNLPLGEQLASHIGTLLFAASFKLFYIARLAALKSLGRPMH